MNQEQVDLLQQDILIIDDTPDNLRVLANILTEQGYNVRKALNGQMALKACERLLPDLILLDIMMPHINGYELCQHLKADEKTRQIPVIFISALDESLDKVKAFSVGGADYITKPFQLEEVLARVKNQLTIRQLHDRLGKQNARLQQLNEELQHANEELRRSNDELQQFTSIVSHDLQSPLQTISLSLELIIFQYKEGISAKVESHILKSLNGVRKMQRLIKELLEYSRVGRGTEEFQPTDCKAVLEEALGNLEQEIAASGASITYSDLPTVMGDRTQLMQLFQNLISNAIKFRHPSVTPRIKISAEAQQGGKWRVGVHDNGIGIEPQHFERIFEIFQRLHNSTEYAGTGIGMSICKKIVEFHGGRLWVESQLGAGSTFYFTISEPL